MEVNNYTPEALVRLPREELRRMLAEELHKDTANIDDTFVRSLLQELEIRGRDPTFTDTDAVKAACEKFQVDTERNQKHQKRWYQTWMLNVASVVLVLGILFFALPGSAQADDLPEILGWWSDNVFQLIRPGQKPNIEEYVYETDHPGLQQFYDTVTELGITEPIVPRWVPDGFELAELKSYPVYNASTLYVHLKSNGNSLFFTIIAYDDKTILQHEKDTSNCSIWDLAGTEHYLLSNNGEQIITWMASGIECTITTDCSEEDMYRIVKSIYAMED